MSRCGHGFWLGKHCQECRQAASLAALRAVTCALCGSSGHFAKMCHQTAVGRRRWSRWDRRGAAEVSK